LIALMATGMGAFLVIVVRQVVRARGEPVRTGQERYIGQTARVRDALEPRGRVWFQGQGWSAIARDGETVPAGQWVRIVAVEGLTLIVEPIEEIDSSDGGGAASR
jgi:membrane-bound serine protease (ClpP class)